MKTIGLLIAINGGGFFLMGGMLHYYFYHHKRDEAERWKIQPHKWQTREKMLEKIPLVLLNACIISSMVGLGLHFGIEGGGPVQMYWDPMALGVPYLVLSTVALFFWYHFTLYYWHRYMHTNLWLYKKIHHVHHKYKDPVWLDALYEHPIEAVYGGIVLSSPLYLWPINGFGYLLFFAIVGLHEILDHAGVKVKLPLLSKSQAHDDHHLRFNYYYGQLLSVLDDFHDTIYYPKAKKKAVKEDAALAELPVTEPGAA